jgi:hypothetical protein
MIASLNQAEHVMLDYIGRTYLRYLNQSATLIRILFEISSKKLNELTYNPIIKWGHFKK